MSGLGVERELVGGGGGTHAPVCTELQGKRPGELLLYYNPISLKRDGVNGFGQIQPCFSFSHCYIIYEILCFLFLPFRSIHHPFPLHSRSICDGRQHYGFSNARHSKNGNLAQTQGHRAVREAPSSSSGGGHTKKVTYV